MNASSTYGYRISERGLFEMPQPAGALTDTARNAPLLCLSRTVWKPVQLVFHRRSDPPVLKSKEEIVVLC